MDKIVKYTFLNSFGTAVYIILVVLFMNYLQTIFPNKSHFNVFIPIFMLLLFVFSAAFTGFLVFGKPIMLYLDGKKKQAVLLITCTLIILFMITLVVLGMLGFYFNLV